MHLDAADLFVLPSHQEGLPRSLIEAMARGLPCIGSAVGGVGDLLESSEMVAPGDVKQLADKIEWMLGNHDRIEFLTRRNVEVAKKYVSSELNRRRGEFYRKVIEISRRD
jgi:glycosyltransferase involved in cell wall biosynthesis